MGDPTLRSAIQKIESHAHLCLIYNSRQEYSSVIRSFIRTGLERGEKCLYIADEGESDAQVRALAAEGAGQRHGALTLTTRRETYLKAGQFDPDWLIDHFTQAAEVAKREGYAGLRVVGEMSWALTDESSILRLLEYEAKLAAVFNAHDVAAICLYDRNLLAPDVLLRVIRTHPQLIIDGIPCRNQFYMPPDEFGGESSPQLQVDRLLKSIHERQTAENALRESEQRYQGLYRAVSVGVIEQDPDGVCTDANEVACEIVGLSREEIIGRSSGDPRWGAIHEDGSPFAAREQPTRLALRRGGPVHDVMMGIQNPRTDSVRWIIINAHPVVDPETGTARSVVATFLDVTEHKHDAQEIHRFNEELARAVAERTAALKASECAQTALSEALAKYEAIFDSFDGYIYICNSDYEMEFVNKGFVNYFGPVSPGAKCYTVLHGLDQPCPQCINKQVFQGETVRWEYQRPLDGQCHDILNVPIHYPDGRIHKMAMIRDVTDRKQAELALRESEERFRTLAMLAPVGIAQLDRSGRCTYVNERFCEILGLTAEEAMAEDWVKCLHADDREAVLLEWQRCQDAGRDFLMDFRVRRPGGAEVWVLSSVIAVRNEAGEISGFMGTLSDITARKLAEEALRESEERFRKIFDCSPLGIGLSRIPDRKLLRVNPALCELLGYSEPELLQMSARDFTHPDDHGADEVKLAQLLNSELRSYTIEKRYLTKSGEIKWISMTAAAVMGPQGEPQYLVAIIMDIGDRKQAEQAMLMASRMEATATLAGGIAHDFNNLMVAVLGNAELLRMQLVADAEAMGMLGDIAQAAQRAGELAQQMLAFARGGKYQPVSMNLRSSIHEVLKLQAHSFPPEITIRRHIEPDLWNVFADPVQMNQVMMNLCINAAEAIVGRGSITITAQNYVIGGPSFQEHPELKPGQYALLTVEDDGCGMPAEVKAHVFEPFFTTKFQGRGLGLAAVYGIVKNHGGLIAVHSEEGVGTIFKVYIPATEVSSARTSPVLRDIPLGTETVLVVDDDTIVLNVTRKILECLGYMVLVAHDGKEAVDVARTHEGPIHLALLDLGMPVLTGSEAFPLLLEARPALKVVIASGYELDEAAQTLLDAGALGFIQKPFRVEVLGKEVRRALDRG